MGNEGQSFSPYADNGLFYEDFASMTRREGIPSLLEKTNVRILHVASLPQEWRLWENGMELRNEDANEFSAPLNPKLGWNGYKNVFTGEPEYEFIGSIAEVVLFDHSLSETERVEVDRYLNGRYGLPNRPLGPTNLLAYSLDS